MTGDPGERTAAQGKTAALPGDTGERDGLQL